MRPSQFDAPLSFLIYFLKYILSPNGPQEIKNRFEIITHLPELGLQLLELELSVRIRPPPSTLLLSDLIFPPTHTAVVVVVNITSAIGPIAVDIVIVIAVPVLSAAVAGLNRYPGQVGILPQIVLTHLGYVGVVRGRRVREEPVLGGPRGRLVRRVREEPVLGGPRGRLVRRVRKEPVLGGCRDHPARLLLMGSS